MVGDSVEQQTTRRLIVRGKQKKDMSMFDRNIWRRENGMGKPGFVGTYATARPRLRPLAEPAASQTMHITYSRLEEFRTSSSARPGQQVGHSASSHPAAFPRR